MIYLASPYSHPDASVREQRFSDACSVAASLARDGNVVFSPIVHGHPLAQHGLPTDWSFWQHANTRLLDACDELVVLTMDGWETSEGVQTEIRIATELGKPVRFLDTTPTLAPVAKEETG